MKRFFAIVFLCLWGFGIQAWSMDITALLDAAARQPGNEVSELAEQESALRAEAATAALYPKIAAFGKAELFSSPTNLRPLPPTEVNIPAGESIPFSTEILRYGLTLEAPLYVHKLYVLREKLLLLAEGASLSRRISTVSREAAVVSLNSIYRYLASLDQAIAGRLESLSSTRESTALKVKTGRLPEAELIKIETSLNDLEQQRNELRAKMLDARTSITKLTGVALDEPVPMAAKAEIIPEELVEVQKGQKDVAAAEKEVLARRAARYPTLSVYGAVSGNDGEAYNTNDHIYRSYNFAGVVLSVPLFDKTLMADVDIANVQLKKARKQLEDVQLELTSLEANLKEKLPIIDRSLRLAEKSVQNDEQLLAIAKVAYDSGRMTIEEYLRYESQVLASQATLNKAVDDRWQIVARQAVLYGVDLRGVVQ